MHCSTQPRPGWIVHPISVQTIILCAGCEHPRLPAIWISHCCAVQHCHNRQLLPVLSLKKSQSKCAIGFQGPCLTKTLDSIQPEIRLDCASNWSAGNRSMCSVCTATAGYSEQATIMLCCAVLCCALHQLGTTDRVPYSHHSKSNSAADDNSTLQRGTPKKTAGCNFTPMLCCAVLCCELQQYSCDQLQ